MLVERNPAVTLAETTPKTWGSMSVCCKVPVNSSFVRDFLPSRHLMQSALKEHKCLFQMSSLPSLGTQVVSDLDLYLKGNFFEEKTNNKRCRNEIVFFSLAASLSPFSLLLKLPCLSCRARTQAHMAIIKWV